jgi:hypothetical protein
MWRLPLGAVLLAFGLPAQDPWSDRLIATVPVDLALASAPITAPDGTSQVDHTRCVFGRDGRFVVYCAYRGARGVAMVGERIVGEFDYLHDPVVDVLREHHAFRAGNRIKPDKERWHAIIDGELGKSYDWIGVVALGRGGVPAYWEQPGAKVQDDGAYSRSAQQFHVGGRTGTKYDDGLSLVMPAWSADGTKVATAAGRVNAWSLLVADAKGEKLDKKLFEFAEDVAISADGKRVAAMVTEGGPPLDPGEPPLPGMDAGKHLLIVDGERVGGSLDGFAPPVFAPNGKRYAFAFLRGDKMGVALDNEKEPKAEHVFAGRPVWSPSGDALCLVTGAGKLEPSARFDARDDYAMAGMTFALRKRRVPGDKVETIVDGCAGLAHVTFGPLPQQLAYAKKADGQWRLVVGDTVSEPFDEVDKPQFRGDGKMVAFGARKGRELWWKVMAVP